MKIYEDYIFLDIEEGSKKHLSIRIYGLLGKACSIHMNAEEYKRYFIKYHDHLKDKFMRGSLNDNEIDYLANYIQSLSDIISVDWNMLEQNFNFLISLMVLMIRYFPYVPKMHHYLVINSITRTANNIKAKDAVKYKTLIANLVYQGVQWSCSHQIDDGHGEDKDAITLKNYFPLWNQLIAGMETDEMLYADMCQEQIHTLLKILHALNLRTQYTTVDEEFLIDPQLQAEKCDDFIIFVNLVDFYAETLPRWNTRELRKYILNCIKHVLKLSIKHPLVIGFYNLLSTWLRISCKTDYFNSERLRQRDDIKHVHEIISLYVQDLLVRIKEYGEDLQTACLEVLISLPTSIIKQHLPSITTHLIVVFKTGHGNLDIVETGIDTLERLNNDLLETEFEGYLKTILPHLEPYLRSKSLLQNENIRVNTRKTIEVLKKRRIIIESDTQLYSLQRKILRFLGKMNSKLYGSFVENGYMVQPISWSQSNCLKITLPYEDKNIDLYMDKFLPKVIELALQCSNRKTRFSACELLHSLATLIIGKSKSFFVLFGFLF